MQYNVIGQDELGGRRHLAHRGSLDEAAKLAKEWAAIRYPVTEVRREDSDEVLVWYDRAKLGSEHFLYQQNAAVVDLGRAVHTIQQAFEVSDQARAMRAMGECLDHLARLNLLAKQLDTPAGARVGIVGG